MSDSRYEYNLSRDLLDGNEIKGSSNSSSTNVRVVPNIFGNRVMGGLRMKPSLKMYEAGGTVDYSSILARVAMMRSLSFGSGLNFRPFDTVILNINVMGGSHRRGSHVHFRAPHFTPDAAGIAELTCRLLLSLPLESIAFMDTTGLVHTFSPVFQPTTIYLCDDNDRAGALVGLGLGIFFLNPGNRVSVGNVLTDIVNQIESTSPALTKDIVQITTGTFLHSIFATLVILPNGATVFANYCSFSIVNHGNAENMFVSELNNLEVRHSVLSLNPSRFDCAEMMVYSSCWAQRVAQKLGFGERAIIQNLDTIQLVFDRIAMDVFSGSCNTFGGIACMIGGSILWSAPEDISKVVSVKTVGGGRLTLEINSSPHIPYAEKLKACNVIGLMARTMGSTVMLGFGGNYATRYSNQSTFLINEAGGFARELVNPFTFVLRLPADVPVSYFVFFQDMYGNTAPLRRVVSNWDGNWSNAIHSLGSMANTAQSQILRVPERKAKADMAQE